MFKLIYSSQARKDYQKAKHSPLLPKIQKLLAILEKNPLQTPPPFEQLTGNLDKALSRKINRQHRLVYEILDNDAGFKEPSGELYEGIVKVIRLWTHYE